MSTQVLPSSTTSARAAARDDRRRSTASLLRAAAQAEQPEHDRLINEAVLLNMGLAESIARRYTHRGIDYDDLVQVAYLGLVNAARRYDPDRGKDFVSFAVPTITGEVKRYFRDHGWTIRPPRGVQELKIELANAKAELAQQYGRTPSTTDLAEYLHVDAGEIAEAEASSECFAPASIDYQGPEGDDPPLAEALGHDDAGYRRSEAITTLGRACRRLGERDRAIVGMRYFHGWTQREIAQRIGISQMQVSRLLSRIHRDLRDEIAEA
ncbi:SigB/SigF/SigG family RNA polymerase sigma factor [Haloactinopolyspora sp.]|uniref:SigB/SigF/SigG family RNA polymerase sigma factor n=1 Tax=Haloactinopolyspora sp. TaxID=1966353 RepID=UPI00262EDE1E|nr:SigB/SigF/SigG family RNA polymerase sigma factor [Haloactinopolyspora sp.]